MYECFSMPIIASVAFRAPRFESQPSFVAYATDLPCFEPQVEKNDIAMDMTALFLTKRIALNAFITEACDA